MEKMNWNTGIQQKKRNLRSFDIKTSLHRAAIFLSLLMDSITQVKKISREKIV